MRPVWLRARWVVGHVACGLLVLLFVNLGWWQLHRLDERRDHNELLASRLRALPEEVGDVVDAEGVDRATYRRVVAEGEWEEGSTALVRSRALEGRQGYHVVGVLDLGGGRGVVVNRGFVPLPRDGDEDSLLASVSPPGGPARVEGVLRPTEERGRLGPHDAAGPARVVNRVDVPRLDERSPLELVPLFVHQTAPAGNGVPQRLPLPAVDDDGPHRAYAGQWFLFATIGACGWPLVVRRAARDDGGGHAG